MKTLCHLVYAACASFACTAAFCQARSYFLEAVAYIGSACSRHVDRAEMFDGFALDMERRNLAMVRRPYSTAGSAFWRQSREMISPRRGGLLPA